MFEEPFVRLKTQDGGDLGLRGEIVAVEPSDVEGCSEVVALVGMRDMRWTVRGNVTDVCDAIEAAEAEEEVEGSVGRRRARRQGRRAPRGAALAFPVPPAQVAPPPGAAVLFVCGPPRRNESEHEQDPCGKAATRTVLYVREDGRSVRRPCCDEHPTYEEVGSHSFGGFKGGGYWDPPSSAEGTSDVD